MAKSYSFLRLLAALPFTTSLVGALSLHEQIAGIPAGWSYVSAPGNDTQIVLQVALAQQNIDQLESKLSSVSTPSSPSYGQYLDLDPINAAFGPSDASKNAVKLWLKSSGISTYTMQGDSVWLKASVAQANSLLGTTFNTYTNSKGESKIRTTQYSLPDSLKAHVDLISPTTYFGTTQSMRSIKETYAGHSLAERAGTSPAGCNSTIIYNNRSYAAITPDCLRYIYNVGDYKPDPRAGSKVAFGSFLNESASFSDLFAFEKYFGISPQNFSVVLVNPEDGATDLPQPPDNANDGEANLDVQNIVAIAHPLPVTEYITAGSPPYIPDPVEPAGTPNENEPYLPYYEFLLSQPNSKLPQVITNSYGDDEQTVPEKYAVRVCNLIGILGLRGVSILESSGDTGVGASCLNQDGKTPQFNPVFPATCPYITSVGGTVGLAPETAWTGSSGGFSNYFKTAWYQRSAVYQYLNTYVSAETKQYYGQYVNFTGRGFPDVAALSVHPDYSVFQGGVLTPSGGTSAAAPVTAAIIALLNDARLRAGRPVLGFLNPWIYSGGYKGFTDITGGQSDGCNGYNTQTGSGVEGSGVILGAHWNATVGWDPVTGFGTPNFGALKDIVLGLGSRGGHHWRA